MTLSMLTPSWAAEPKDTAAGSLQATLRLDYNQSLEELQARDIRAELLRGTSSLGSVSLTKPDSAKLSGCPAQVTLRDRLGDEHTGSATPGALDLSVTGLSQGDYTLRFTGQGYTRCEVPFTIRHYSQYIEVGTGDGTFALGDFDGNASVNAADLEALSNALGSTDAKDADRYDLNGDGQISIIDLAYVNHNANISAAKPLVLDTVCLDAQLDEAQASQALNAAGTQIRDGDLTSLFQEEGASATFENKSGGDSIQIPLPLTGAVETENIQIVTPDSAPGAIQSGTLEVEYEGSSEPLRFSFQNDAPEGVHAIARTPGSNVITISLGRRVAVKKITISVTKTEGGDYATVETIRFLKDVVSEDLAQPNSEVTHLAASAGDSKVDLRWRALPNVSGYRVDYWEKGKESARRQLPVDVPQAQVTGLDNLKTYLFTVTPLDDGWQGRTCAPVEAMPMPAKVPSAPDMVTVTPLDGQLAVSWKSGENATFYEVYYTSTENAPLSAYTQTGGQLTGTKLNISGLTNDTTYYLYVIAGNEVGRSGPSRIYSGTPKGTDYSRPEGLPTQGLLDNAKIQSIVLADPGNYHAIRKGKKGISVFL